MNLNLIGKVIVLSGNTNNKNIAELLIAEEAIPVVIINEKLNSNVAICNTFYSITTDLNDAEACKSVIQKIIQQFGKIDALVNNSINVSEEALSEINPQQFIDTLQQTLVPYFLLTQHTLSALKATKGTVVNVVPTINNRDNHTNALTALTREWAVELVKYNIRVNAVLHYYTQSKNDEIANMIAFLLSERSSHITGQFIEVNHDILKNH